MSKKVIQNRIFNGKNTPYEQNQYCAKSPSLRMISLTLKGSKALTEYVDTYVKVMSSVESCTILILLIRCVFTIENSILDHFSDIPKMTLRSS